MILLTTAAHTPSSSMSWAGLEAPRDHFLWSSEAQDWTSTTESTSSPTSRMPTSSSTIKDEGLTHNVSDSTIHCYLCAANEALFNWSTDHVGHTAPLTKELKKFVAASFNKVDVAEVYCPPRVTKRARLHGLRPGWALDLSTGWDFSKRSHRRAALRLISKTRPAVLMLSPPCCVFSPLRNLTNFKRDPSEVQSEEAQGQQHLDFAVSLANLQIENGRGFLFEHPRGAKSWRTSSLQRLASNQAVCAFGLQGTQGLHKKPTLLLTNIEELALTLAKRCNQQHEHQPIEGGSLSRASAQYTDAFVDAILKGIRKHLFFEAMHVEDLPDNWSRSQGNLCCRHFRPRCTPPLPADSNFDLTNVNFTGKRIVTKHYVNGATKVVEDDWNKSSSAADSVSWTGITVFEVQQNIMLPHNFQQLATWVTRSLAHPLLEYQRDQSSFAAEYMLVFPSRKILGGEVRERRQNLLPTSSASATDGRNLQVPEDQVKVGRELREIDVHPAEEPPLPPELRRELCRVHRNLGHPDNQSFCRALRHAGVKPEFILGEETLLLPDL